MRYSFLLLLALCSFKALSAEEAKPPEKKKDEPASKKKAEDMKEKKPTVVDGTVTVGGKSLSYQATAAMLPILKPDGKPSAQIFHTVYQLKDQKDKAQRPVTFCFNGGPGSSSVWLHLGAFGPKRVDLAADGLTAPKPPGKLTANEFSLLNVTDLVFIDPVNTGYSKAEDPQKANEFLGVQEDITAVAEFIRLWLSREQRWRSPKFIAGESYGGIRGGGLAEHLAKKHRIYLNGLIIVSGVLDYDVLLEGPINDLPYQVLLPALATVAQYHQRLPSPLQQLPRAELLQRVRSFAYTDYATALLLEHDLPKEKREAVARQLAQFTGLPLALIQEQNLRIDSGTFREMLLRDQGLVLGAYDARVTGRDGSSAEGYPLIDPFMNVIGGIAAATMNAYLREELKYEADLPYEILASQPKWNHGEGNSFTSVTRQLGNAMKSNNHLQVLALVGWADLVTPPDNIIHSLRHMPLPAELRQNVHVKEYDAGHMMYTNRKDMEKMHSDITTFIQQCLAP
jgi:carboxypeptidase C (cathepsin A)